jgi:pilus assembly protein CpaC
VLGALFKSRDYVNRQTELAVIVTPYVVRAVAQKTAVAPGRRFRRPERPGNRAARPPQPDLWRCRQGRSQAHVRGNYGFILD